MTVKVTLNPGHKMNYHSHEKRDEVWTVISGTGTTIVDGMEQPVKPGDVVTMAAGCKHTVIAGDTGLQLIEVQLGTEISVADKKKYEMPLYSWGADICIEMASGINNNAWRVTNAANNLANAVSNIVGFSIPKEGPLSDADEYS